MNAIGGDANHHVSVNGLRIVLDTVKAAPSPDASLAFPGVLDTGLTVPRIPRQGAAS